MLNLIVTNTETVCSKLKSGNRFLKPNFELLPSHRQVRQVRRVNCHFLGSGLYRISKNSSRRIYEELLLERGPYPGVEIEEQPDEPDAPDSGDAFTAT
jgi:hypothetical protein